mgnify:FL=1
MYRYELEVTHKNGDTTWEYVWAENTKDAQESGELMFPDALYIEVI